MNATHKLRLCSGRLGNIFFRLSVFCLVAAILCVGSTLLSLVLMILYFAVLLLLIFVTLFTILIWGRGLFAMSGLGITASVAAVLLTTGAVLGALSAVFSVLSAILLRLDAPINRARDRDKFIAMVVIAVIGLVVTIAAIIIIARGGI